MIIRQQLNDLAGLILDLNIKTPWVQRSYSDEELGDTMIILMEVLLSKTVDKHKDKLSQEQLELLSEELWKSLHQTVSIFTWVDMHKMFD